MCTVPTTHWDTNVITKVKLAPMEQKARNILNLRNKYIRVSDVL